MKNSMKKMIGILLAAVMIASIFSVLPISASAAGENELPASFDLRDRGVVTPIRIQDPWGSCWAFGSIAAAEASILSMLQDKGQGIDAKTFDLSEKHLIWFGTNPISEAIDPDTWTHYTYKDEGTGHMICIVGWDDDYSVSNFKKGHQPPANGAWLVKNSWGCETEYEESATGKHIGESKWGVENEEGKTTGYFWISYYDKSLSYCESMTFDTDLAEAEGELSVKMYDYMPSLIGVRTGQVTEEQSSNLLKTANVFVNDTETDVSLVSVSTKTASPNATVKYSVYLLTDNAANPEDGVLLGTKTATYEYAGFHREKLDGSITVKNGEKYAVVAEETVVENGNKLYEYAVNASYSKEHAEAVQAAEAESGISSDDRDRNADEYGVAVVNKGESFVYDNGAWTDWAESEPLVY